ncbi:hypothetical protein F2P81_010874 [Scophthalmus maximus]|uniref:Gypsy retrotransposon integrase-like protein 1 n=1 Tax=Scophthalmus maximus TaxID=52904 RepID=A0A6A4T1T8_SCOMX|nr:hypothetical protein F2P81_010874 [Scophthalmus maximus]
MHDHLKRKHPGALRPQNEEAPATFFTKLIERKYEENLERVKASIKEVKTRITLITDASIATEAYLGVTCHFINEDWELTSYNLNTMPSEENNTAGDIAAQVEKAALKFGISMTKIIVIVHDNARNVVAALRMLEEKHGVTSFRFDASLIVHSGEKVICIPTRIEGPLPTQADLTEDKALCEYDFRCCEEDLRKDLTRVAGKSLVDIDEKDVLAAMKALAVLAENTMVARVALSYIRQGHEEPIRSFHARLKGQVDTCKYEMKCTKVGCDQVNDFTEEILRDVIARGIADQEIQLDLLGENNHEMPLKETIEYIEAKESGKHSASGLLDPQSMDTISSSYRRGKQPDARTRGGARPEKPKAKPEGTCIYCGEVGHGKTPQWRTRRAECGKTCQKCNHQNHLNKVCLGSRMCRSSDGGGQPGSHGIMRLAEPLTKPTALPMPATKANGEALREHLLRTYAQSTFNTCPHQTLLTMSGPPLRLMLDQDATPVGDLRMVGMKNRAADAMSHRPVGTSRPSLMDLPDDNATVVNHLSPSTRADILSLLRRAEPEDDDFEEGNLTWCTTGFESLRSVTWDRVGEATSSDGDMRMLEEMAVKGFPELRIGMPEAIRGFHQYREDITSAEGVVLCKDRVLISPSLRGEVLSALHAAHQGVSMMTARAQSSVFWPGLSANISATQNDCKHCHRQEPSQPVAPPTPPIPARYTFQAVCLDFFMHRGVHYLVTVDRYSNWPIILSRSFRESNFESEAMDLKSQGTDIHALLHRRSFHPRLRLVPDFLRVAFQMMELGTLHYIYTNFRQKSTCTYHPVK